VTDTLLRIVVPKEFPWVDDVRKRERRMTAGSRKILVVKTIGRSGTFSPITCARRVLPGPCARRGICVLRRGETPDLVLLDILLPNATGWKCCADPVGQSVADAGRHADREGDETDRIVGLELGGRRLHPQAVQPREVVARIKAILRRSRPGAREPPPRAGDVLTYRELRMDVAATKSCARGSR